MVSVVCFSLPLVYVCGNFLILSGNFFVFDGNIRAMNYHLNMQLLVNRPQNG